MMILEGAQGIGKTSFLRILGGNWYDEITEDFGTKDFKQKLMGCWIAEIGELASLKKAERSNLKATLTCKVDRFRPPYGRMMKDYPRTAVFVGTTNEEEYLTDPTGNRRFFPIKCGGKIELGWLEAHRDQLFAEAMAAFNAGETWHEMPPGVQEEETSARQIEDPWAAPIIHWWHKQTKNGFHLATVLEGTFPDEYPLGKQTTRDLQRVSAILKGFGFEKSRPRAKKGEEGRLTEWKMPLEMWDPPKKDEEEASTQ
jgi:putative DNA primase/helicase